MSINELPGTMTINEIINALSRMIHEIDKILDDYLVDFQLDGEKTRKKLSQLLDDLNHTHPEIVEKFEFVEQFFLRNFPE